MRRFLFLLLLSGFFATRPALASGNGRRNTAYALTGAAIYGLVKHKTVIGVAAGAGALVAWQQAEQARKAEKRQREARAHRERRRCRHRRHRNSR